MARLRFANIPLFCILVNLSAFGLAAALPYRGVVAFGELYP